MRQDPELAADLTRILTAREKLSATQIRNVVTAIEQCAHAYHDDRLHEQRAAAWVAWVDETTRRVGSLERWLETAPPHEPDEMETERERMSRELNAFRVWLKWFYDPWKPRHRLIDTTRALLEEGVGAVLFDAGVVITTASAGTYARVLERVYAAVGLSSLGSERSAHKAVRQACANHPEWRTVPEVRTK